MSHVLLMIVDRFVKVAGQGLREGRNEHCLLLPECFHVAVVDFKLRDLSLQQLFLDASQL